MLCKIDRNENQFDERTMKIIMHENDILIFFFFFVSFSSMDQLNEWILFLLFHCLLLSNKVNHKRHEDEVKKKIVVQLVDLLL